MGEKDPSAEESDSVEMLSGAESAKLFQKAEVPDSWQENHLTHSYGTDGTLIFGDGTVEDQEPFKNEKNQPAENLPEAADTGE